MKKALLSPLSSALVIPGLGQVLNQDLKKGALILLMVFIIFVAGVVKLYRMVDSAFDGIDLKNPDTAVMMERLLSEDGTLLWVLGIAMALVWVYSVVDAFLSGRRIDQQGQGGPS